MIETFLREHHTLIMAMAYGFGGMLPIIVNNARKRESFASRGYRYGKSVRKFLLWISGKNTAR